MNEIQQIQGASFDLSGIQIPDNTTKEQWTDIHRQIIVAKKASGAWLKQSRAWASQRYGDEFVGQTEAQLELSLGLLPPPEPSSSGLNPSDKSRAITNIQGISTSFNLWYRKMEDKIESWDRQALSQALDLITPMEQAAHKIRERLSKVSTSL